MNDSQSAKLRKSEYQSDKFAPARRQDPDTDVIGCQKEKSLREEQLSLLSPNRIECREKLKAVMCTLSCRSVFIISLIDER